jgi:hypothetical protein
VHHLVSGVMIHSLPGRSVIDHGVSRKELVRQVTRFCLQGMGLRDQAIRRCWKRQGIAGDGVGFLSAASKRSFD